MKAAMYRRYGPPEVIEIGELPPPECGPEQVLVKVAAVAINPKDALIRSGRLKRYTSKQFPKRLGADYAGTVVQTGRSVRGLKVGDAVYGMLHFRNPGATAEYLVANPDEVSLLPAGLSFAQAASLPLAALTALQALRDLGGVGPGSEVAINGASGGVGTLAVQIAKALGARVTALCGASSADVVRAFGADEVLDYRVTAPTELPGSFDCFFDVYGNQCLALMRDRLKPRGRYISTTLKPHNFRDHLLTRFWGGRRGLLVVVRPSSQDLQTLARWTAEGRLKPVVAHVLPLSEMARAHELIQSQHTHGKIVVTLE